jgi:signal transduction histidine kinase
VAEIESYRVLVIEDDTETRTNLCEILELDGYRVSSVGTAEETFCIENLNDFAAIILDRRLPDGTADELLPQLRQEAPSAAIIIVTGYADLDSTIAALRHGAADFILKPVNPELLRASLNRLRQLREAEVRAQRSERLAAIGIVVAGVAHESRNAMQRIQARVDLLRLSLEGQNELLHDLDAIEAANRSLRLLYDELREFAAPIQLRRENCQLDQLIASVWDDMAVHPHHADATLTIHSNNCMSDVDTMRIEQVFRNLFENTLSACTAPIEVEIRCECWEWRGRKMVRVTIRDNGPGFSAQQREQAFEPFYTTKCEGTGLGLAISRRIVDLHDGRISIQSSGTDGAEIVLLLPAPEE